MPQAAKAGPPSVCNPAIDPKNQNEVRAPLLFQAASGLLPQHQYRPIYNVITMLYNEIESEWDEQKSYSNLKKHGVEFEEAITIWIDPNALETHDRLHSIEEERWIKIGMSCSGMVITVVYTERENYVRPISARQATQHEAKQYYERRIRLL
jgi:uncharacterized DUF497 family protein